MSFTYDCACGRVIAERAGASDLNAGFCYSEAIVSPRFSVAKVALSLCQYVLHSLEDGASMICCRTLLLALQFFDSRSLSLDTQMMRLNLVL